jgi:hypothetical protein
MRFLLIILILVSKVFFSQNLVPNSSLETFTSCPASQGQIFYTSNWFGPSSNSTDYFNKCSVVTVLSPPNCGAGYQETRSGNAMAGIWAHGGNGNFREYLMSGLTQILKLDTFYHLKFYCVLANNSKLTIKNLGIAATSNSFAISGPTSNNVINLSTALYNYDNNYLIDTLNWTKIEGIYKANGNEKYVIIGNFKNDASSDTISTSHGNYYYSYFYIDDVSVEPICTPFWSYRDTTLVIGDSVLIGPAITGLNINWYDATSSFITNAPGIYVKPAVTTTYTAVEDFCGNTYTNTIVVTVTPTAIKEYEKEQLKVELYPNPAQDVLTVTSRFDFEKIELLSITGQILLQEMVNSKKHELQLQNYADGIYFVKVIYGNGLSVSKKVVVNH